MTGGAIGEGTPAQARGRSRRLAKAGLWAATAAFLLAGLWAASLLARHGLAALTFPYPLNYGEGPLLDQAARLAGLRNIYPADLSRPPYVISNYPPLYVLFQAPFVSFFGPEFWYGRAISLLSTLASAALISALINALYRDRIAALAGGLTFLGVPFVLHWSSLGRVDMLGLALSLAGLCVVVRQPRGSGGLILAALLLVAAIYTRQTLALAAPLAAFVYLLAEGRRRRALALSVLVGGTSLLLLGTLTALTGGGFFFHTITSNVNDWRWDQLTFYLSSAQALMPLLLLGGLAFLVLGLRSRPSSWWALGAYFLAASATALLVGKIGSDVNYLLELSAALSLAAGALLARYADRPGVRSALLLALALQVVLMVQGSQSFYANLQGYAISQREGIERLDRIVKRSERPVLADEYAGLVPLNGKRIYLQPFEMTQLAREGKWDQRLLLAAIASQRFSAILVWEPPYFPGLEDERWTPGMLRAIREHYEPAETRADTVVYRPR
jgi:hypothetical protein